MNKIEVSLDLQNIIMIIIKINQTKFGEDLGQSINKILLIFVIIFQLTTC